MTNAIIGSMKNTTWMLRLFVILFLIWPLPGLASLSSVAFFYGSQPPIDQLRSFDVVVVSPEANINPKQYNTSESKLFAYVSVGEVADSALYRQQISPRWLLGNNSTWQSKVIDQTQPEWQAFFLEKIIAPLWAKGYHGFFLDTLDSYTLVAHDAASQQQQITGLVNLIRAIKAKYPDAKLILNRGFELVSSVSDLTYAVAAESLFSSWNQQKQQYVSVSVTDRNYLLTQLRKVQKLGLPVIVIDYVAPNQREKARTVAQKIINLGMIPWVTDGQLQTLGVGRITALPRKIFVIYTLENKNTTLFNPSAFTSLGLPLQYLGYLPEYHDGNMSLPTDFHADDYAGIVVWANPATSKQQKNLHDWLVSRLKQQIPIAFVSGFGFAPTPEALAPFGLVMSTPEDNISKPLRITQQDHEVVGFEIQPHPNYHEFIPIQATHSRILLQLQNQKNQHEDAVAITPWGGYALDPYVTTNMPDAEDMWVINPLKWLPQVLHLSVFPVVDVTTENGRRLMLVHIDGDGFASQAEWQGGDYASAELEKQILEKYRIPTSVSVITAEIAPNGLHANISSQLIKIAQRIFALPWVEVASHTFSHPFDWILVQKYPTSGRYNLPVPGYHFSGAAEIGGSADYINQNLVPAGKSCKVLFWSGYANPDEKTLALTYQANIGNLNGGNTDITDTFPSITHIGPYGRQQGDYFQVYAPISNEEFYTHSWSGPFYGFEQVIQTFKLTDAPNRFKPIDIYYHFYSASKLASLAALNKVYQWALSQPVMNIFASEYVADVIDFTKANIARIDDGWQIRTSGVVRELRAPLISGYPDLARSQNLIGYIRYNDVYYLHLGPASQSIIYFSKQPSSLPYLLSANGKVIQFQRESDGMIIHLQSYVPLQWEFANMTNCEVSQKKHVLNGTPTKTSGVISYTLSSKDSDELRIQCNRR